MKYWFETLKNSGSLGILMILTFLISTMGLLSPIFIIHIFNRYISFGLQGTLFFLVSGAISVAIFEFVFRNLRNKIFNEVVLNPSKNIKIELVKQFFNLEAKFPKKNFIDIIDFANNFFQFISPKNQSSLFDFFFALLIICILFFLDFFLASIFLIILFLFILIQNKMIHEKKQLLMSHKFSNEERYIVKEIASNQDLIKSSNAINYTGFKVEKYFEKKLKIDSLISEIDARQSSFTNFFIILSSVIMIGIGSMIVVEGSLSIGSLIGFNIFSTRALGIIASTQNSFHIMKKTDEYIKDCNEYFNESINRSDGMQLSRCDGIIEIRNLDFSYLNDSNFLLRNLSASFDSGQISVVCGSNASGKSTLAKLLVGLLKPKSGEILVDNTNLDKLSLVWYRQNISYVPQNIEILNSSIMDNILLSNQKLNEQEVSRLLQTVGLDNELKNSNLTITGVIDQNISNGILKKIQIARAIAKNSTFYIFDDPLLFLDLNGKKMIMKLLTSLKRSGKTVICFSNDEEIINFADKKIKIGKDDD